MTADLKEVLRNTLDELTKADFKRFKCLLRDQNSIPWGMLEEADTDDTVDLIVQKYTMKAGEIVSTILKKMNNNLSAMALETLTASSGGTPMPQQGEVQPDLQPILTSHKLKMKKKVQCISKSMGKSGNEILVKKIHTELYITDGKTEEVNNDHEILQVETASRAQTTEERSISCNDIFKPLPEWQTNIRTVLMMGIAGIGKTVSVKKFILDWAEGEANEDIDLMFMLSFRELNLLKTECSLHELLCVFNSELKQLDGHTSVYDEKKVVIIFDGLDESRIHLDFNNEIMASVTKASSVDVLITNIIRGTLLSTALVWITSRPAAASQIPSSLIDQFTEVRGFTDAQKKQYFLNHINNEMHANYIFSHIEASRTLHIMCHIPVFCYILATVLQKMLNENASKKEMPQTVTEMYIFFLLIQMQSKNKKYNGKDEENKERLLDSERDAILKLAELAYRHLKNNSILFIPKDMAECNIDVNDASYSGMITGIFKEDSIVSFEEKIYCFVHLTIQEFFAALHVFASFLNKNEEVIKEFLGKKAMSCSVDELLKSAVNKALESKNGHLDLFVRFLHGISLESNQRLLLGLLKPTHSNPESVDKTIKNLKVMQRPNISPERCINLFHCLLEMKDSSVQNEIQAFLKKDSGSVKQLTLAHCSALAYVLLMSKTVLDKFDLKSYPTSTEGRRRLIPAVKSCKKARLSDCQLTEKSCEIVASALQSTNSPLTELYLSQNDLQKSEEKLVFALQSPNCKLETLRLVGCGLSEKFGDILAFALLSANSHLKELDLSKNTLGSCGGKQFSEPLNMPSKLKTLRLADCGLTENGGDILAFALQSKKSPLKELDLSNNTLGNCEGKLLSEALNPRCTLKKLKLAGCKLTEKSSEVVATALQYMVFLTELDLSHNDLNIIGIYLLKVALSNPRCKLQILRLAGCKLTEESCKVLASAAQSWASLEELDLRQNQIDADGILLLHYASSDSTCKLRKLRYGAEELRKFACVLALDPDTANQSLLLSESNRKVTHVTEKCPYPDHLKRFDEWHQVLCQDGLSECYYWETEWSGTGADIGVAYEFIERKGTRDVCGFRRNDKSWCLSCSGKSYSAWHNNEETALGAPDSGSNRVGLYLDWPAGTLSFYSVSSDTSSPTFLSHLHTFHLTFNEPLYPGFRVKADSSVYLCEMTQPPNPN
ncbi:NLR family CARD domain-containing protein 3-like isoform X2 [Alosa sapidissima]|uniref:NLR family CARD domain-containing protein 3-like isoform X2 n=1 Tax=Alosa sapidissima TaxID=34773 RepID=UPI001C0977E9|nr:NLR family CARD domain-containing protein 3-like isoform X2 [Alosa sapidissima]